MAPSPKKIAATPLRVVYDAPVDVLHVTVGDPVPYEGEGLPRGVEIDYALHDGVSCGAKVIGFVRNGWKDETRALAMLLSSHLDVSATDIAIAIVKATGK